MNERVQAGLAESSLLKSITEDGEKYMRFAGARATLNKASQRGFSLVELIMVIMIITIMCAVAIPFLSPYIENRDLKTAADTIVSDIYATKENALSSGNVYTVVFNTQNNSYAISQCDSNGNNCMVQSTGSPTSIRNTIVFDPASLPNFSGTALQLTFQPRGTANSGTVGLKNSRGSKATINVSTTGRASVNWKGTLK